MRINTKLVGVSFGDRQGSIDLLSKSIIVGNPWVLGWCREPDNQYDKNSVLVFVGPFSKVEIGHLSAEIAAKSFSFS